MKIVGICLVRNDDRFLDYVLANVVDFCDELIIADHQSKDHTSAIARKWADSHEHVRYESIAHPSESHELIRPYCGKDVWLFAVDGDELYDRERLAKFRKQLINGRFKSLWQILGKVLHCNDYDEMTGMVKGYLGRPSRSMTKLYNFSVIEDWKGPCTERLHHGEIVFKKGYEQGKKDHSESEMDWDDAVFRCLHMVFLRRSSLQSEDDVSRPNIAEKNGFSKFQKITYLLFRFIGKEPKSRTKHLTYMRGDCVTLDSLPFFVKHEQH